MGEQPVTATDSIGSLAKVTEQLNYKLVMHPLQIEMFKRAYTFGSNAYGLEPCNPEFDNDIRRGIANLKKKKEK